MFILAFVPIHTAHAEESNNIQRHILKQIEYDELNSIILVHYVLIQQVDGQKLLVNEDFVKKIFLDDASGFTNDNITEKVKNDRSLYADVFVNDEVLGRDAYIYGDLRGEKLTSERLDQLVKDVKAQNKKDFGNPPSEDQLSEVIVKKMSQDGFKEIKQSKTNSLFIKFVMPVVFVIFAFNIVLGVVRRIKPVIKP